MAMTPREARTVTFTEDRRGYAPNEVHEYQERVADALRLYESEVGRLKARLEQSEERIGELQDAEDAVRRTFLAASQTKREMVEEAEADAARVRREADEAAARLRATTDEETSRQRAAAKAEAIRLVEDARVEAHETRAKAETEVRLLERRLLQLRTSITDLEERLRDFAGRALDELSVAGGMIDLETADLTTIEGFEPEPAPVAEAPAPPPEVVARPEAAAAADEPEVAVAPKAAAPEEAAAPEAAAPEETAAPEPAAPEETAREPAPAAAADAGSPPEVAAPAAPPAAAPAEVPAPAPMAAASVEAAPAGPAVGIPVPSASDAGRPELDEEEPDGSFYERRLAGLRRRIESASDD